MWMVTVSRQERSCGVVVGWSGSYALILFWSSDTKAQKSTRVKGTQSGPELVGYGKCPNLTPPHKYVRYSAAWYGNICFSCIVLVRYLLQMGCLTRLSDIKACYFDGRRNLANLGFWESRLFIYGVLLRKTCVLRATRARGRLQTGHANCASPGHRFHLVYQFWVPVFI